MSKSVPICNLRHALRAVHCSTAVITKVMMLAELDEETGVSYWRLADVRASHQAAGENTTRPSE